jgi:hypothetical protein
MAVPFTYTWRDHVEHARHNEAFLDRLTKDLHRAPEWADWALVVTFYAALHYTKAAILRDHHLTVPRHTGHWVQGVWQSGHNDLVRQHLPRIKVQYKELFDAGHDARYRAYFKTSPKAVLEVARQRILLDQIKTECGF